MSDNKNPRGIQRPHDGRGQGHGVPNGQRQGQNTCPCQQGNAGYGQGAGQGKGQGRSDGK